MEPVTIIVGAGASCTYGLPSGLALRQKICAGSIPPKLLADLDEDERRVLKSEYSSMQTAFHNSRLDSIDRFLQYRKSFADLGRMAICYSIYQEEIHAKYDIEECWIRWVFNKLVSNHGSDTDKWPVNFVIFNYDRIVEYLLSEMYANTFDISFAEAHARITKSIGLVHVYGAIKDDPSLFKSKGNRAVFGLGNMSIHDMASDIRVMGDDRSGEQAKKDLSAAITYVKKASTLVFLGFSFDPVNCKLIGLHPGHQMTKNAWYSSGYKMQTREKQDVDDLLGVRVVFGDYDMKCLSFLRECVSL